MGHTITAIPTAIRMAAIGMMTIPAVGSTKTRRVVEECTRKDWKR